jgi:hypothetical protein
MLYIETWCLEKLTPQERLATRKRLRAGEEHSYKTVELGRAPSMNSEHAATRFSKEENYILLIATESFSRGFAPQSLYFMG